MGTRFFISFFSHTLAIMVAVFFLCWIFRLQAMTRRRRNGNKDCGCHQKDHRE